MIKEIMIVMLSKNITPNEQGTTFLLRGGWYPASALDSSWKTFRGIESCTYFELRCVTVAAKLCHVLLLPQHLLFSDQRFDSLKQLCVCLKEQLCFAEERLIDTTAEKRLLCWAYLGAKLF